ncbi:hypothetical protein D9757_010565 [Collybiopsis confluens]|uniref:Uncharacterized protein n=1 Tax=Collybiopsis confluens TaxID=2823264 RepID=A0A8H5GXU2_9AGAR|nr:hypothetical protein D9757_010565 [Collybiopsis confluens]
MHMNQDTENTASARSVSPSTPTESQVAEKPQAPQPPSFPEGGLQAWSTVLGAFLFQFSTFGSVNAFGVFNDFYVREYLNEQTSSDIGWIGSVQLFITLSMAIVTGRLFDRGYFHHLMIAGSVVFVFCAFMLSLSHEHKCYQAFLSHGLGIGLGTGLGYLPSLGIGAHYFFQKRPLVMGIIAAVAPMGAVIHPIMLNKLIHGSLGFHYAV